MSREKAQVNLGDNLTNRLQSLSVPVDAVGLFYHSRVRLCFATAPSATSDDCTDGDRLVLPRHTWLI